MLEKIVTVDLIFENVLWFKEPRNSFQHFLALTQFDGSVLQTFISYCYKNGIKQIIDKQIGIIFLTALVTIATVEPVKNSPYFPLRA